MHAERPGSFAVRAAAVKSPDYQVRKSGNESNIQIPQILMRSSINGVRDQASRTFWEGVKNEIFVGKMMNSRIISNALGIGMVAGAVTWAADAEM